MARVDWETEKVQQSSPPCPYVPKNAVGCSNQTKCDTCGWQKKVSDARLAKIREELISKKKTTYVRAFDVYAVAAGIDGNYIVTKNGELFLTCGKSKENAENIAGIMNSDVSNSAEKQQAATP